MSTSVYLGIGSNLGDRGSLIKEACKELSAHPKIKFLKSAPIYETDPIGGPAQGRYLNTVWEIETQLSAKDLLVFLFQIEEKLGRKRAEKNGPRVIDLDILFFGDQVINQPGLEIPHPRIPQRWFVLKPLWDLRADLVHPVLEKSVCELLDEVDASHKKSRRA